MARKQFRFLLEELFSGNLSHNEGVELLKRLYKRNDREQDIEDAVCTMRSYSVPFRLPSAIHTKLIDNCGTGGDHSGSFNISTTVSFILAASGLYVAKHGNRSVTSRSGSADVLEALGINLSLSPQGCHQLLEKTHFCFLFAQHFHPAMRHVMPIRRQISHRTIFNLIGPLTNPALPSFQLIGVYSPKVIKPVAHVLARLGIKRALVVSSRWGFDEIHINGLTDAAFIENGHVNFFTIDPLVLGFKPCNDEQLKGGDAHDNALILQNILQGKGNQAQHDIVILNAGAGLWVGGKAPSLHDGIKMAHALIMSGKAFKTLKNVIAVSETL